MTKIGVVGANGRMGQALVQACLRDQSATLSAALVRPGHPAAGGDAGELAGAGQIGVSLQESLSESSFDVLIDFTRPDYSMEVLKTCCGLGRGLVIGTTGFNEPEKQAIHQASKEIPIVFAPNMSIGVNLCLKLVELAASVFDGDIEIIEAHHRHKVDAPSGTALALGESAATARNQVLDDVAVLARQGQSGPREKGAIGFATVRAGEIVGEHTVLFAGVGERVEITHRATSRSVFADGAVRAATWVHPRPPGLYDMGDVLGFGSIG